MKATKSMRSCRKLVRTTGLCHPAGLFNTGLTRAGFAEKVTVQELQEAFKTGDQEKYGKFVEQFQERWNRLAAACDADAESSVIDTDLTDLQKEKVDFLISKSLELGALEMRYLDARIAYYKQRDFGVTPYTLGHDWPNLQKDGAGVFPMNNPNWFLQQETMAKISLLGGFGGPAEGAAEGAEEEAPKEVEAEKTHFDVQLDSFEAGAKIKIIKEVRSLLGLGLKEAKETVEKAPVWLQKGVKKEDAEVLSKKLEELGAKITLA